MDQIALMEFSEPETPTKPMPLYDELHKAFTDRLESLGGMIRGIGVTKNKKSVSLKSNTLTAASFAEKTGKNKKTRIDVDFRLSQSSVFPHKKGAAQKNKKYRITYDSRAELLADLDLFLELAISLLSSGEGFGCCGRYEKCSDAGKCLHPDYLTSLACAYRKNLKDGRIFYGKNRNIGGDTAEDGNA